MSGLLRVEFIGGWSEGFLDVKFRNGWEMRPLDFTQIDKLYELRILLEQTSVHSMKSFSLKDLNLILLPLEAIWQVSFVETDQQHPRSLTH